MPPKAAEKKIAAAVWEKTERVTLNQISVAEDSGWRDPADDHVEALKKIVLGGEFGSTTLAKPSLLMDTSGREVVSSCDGCYVINNGKQFIMALQQLETSFKEAQAVVEAAKAVAEGSEAACPPEEEQLWPAWLLPDLRKVYTDGLLVDWVRYPTDDRLTHIALQCLSHESEQNMYRVSTIGDKVEVMKKAWNTSRDWTKAKKAILDVLGESKASTVQRWIVLARDLDEAFITWVKQSWPTLPQAFVVKNKFLIGKGEESRQRLSSEYAIVATRLLQEQVEDVCGKVNAGIFEKEFCAPMGKLEQWVKTQTRSFGETATRFHAFNRLVRTSCFEFIVSLSLFLSP